MLRSSDFRRVYDKGTRYTCPLFAAFTLPVSKLPLPVSKLPLRDATGPLIGFTTPKALGRAVVRNRIRRRMREAVRLDLASLKEGDWAIVFNPRRKAQDCPFSELQAEVKRLFIRCADSSSCSSSGTNA